MGRRQKRKQKKTESSQAPLVRARQLVGRGDLRSALKEAKAAHAKDPSPEHRRFLELVYLRRAGQLLRRDLFEEGRAVLRDLMQLGISEPEVRAEAPALLVEAGLIDDAVKLAGGGALHDHPRLLAAAADQAVLHPSAAPGGWPEARRHAEAVRAALQSVEQGKDEEADAALADIPRDSPFADWRIFVRGLSAFYRHQPESQERSWSRLDPDRAPARIARSLRGLGDGQPSAGAESRGSLDELDRSLNHPVLGPLKKIVQFAAQGAWGEATAALRAARGAIRNFDPQVLERIVSVLYNRLVFEGNSPAVQKLSRAVDPPPLDPYWHRAWAIVAERVRHGGPRDVEKHWLQYEKDLVRLPIFNEQERRLARALVWRRIAEFWQKSYVPRDRPSGRLQEGSAEARILESAEKCVELAPEHAFAHHALIDACETIDDTRRAADAHRRLLDRFPDDLDSHQWLLAYCLLADEPEQALTHAEQARRQRPLDDRFKAATANCRVARARHLALDNRFAEAREQFAAAEQVFPRIKDDFAAHACRSVFEEKAGDAEAADTWRRRAEELLAEPTPLTLALAAEARRYKLPVARAKQWNDQWKNELKQKCNSETAGAMCRLMVKHMVDGTEYVGRKGHISELRKYVRRCTRVKWREEDLRHVCRFLRQLFDGNPSESPQLLERFLEMGIRTFPSSPFFYFHRGEVEMAYGPWDCDRYLAHDWFSKAVKFAEASSFAEDKSILEAAKRRLTFLGEVGPPPPAFMEHFFDSFGGYDDEDEDDEWDDDAAPLPPDSFNDPAVRELVEMMARKMGLDLDDALDAMTQAGFEMGEPLPGPHSRPGAAPHKSKRR